ncbi:protein FAM216A isoform X1 [Bufo bufo]|uniref:protein FAM216A isoform X1 n=1 Tax=Bufo bufo TaxID=8384 RepID=UPI001ABE52A8|nr:protein FAM216A isoform X1 [Bufo bufo]
MERPTRCPAPSSKSKNIPAQKKPTVRSMDCGRKDLGAGAHDEINSKDSWKGCRLQIVPLRQEVKTIKIPRSMKNEAFLKHPDLTMGQKRYLCSIARIYSTRNMRALTEKHQHSKIRCGSKNVHQNLPVSGKSKNEIKGHCRRVHTAATTAMEEIREQITCLSVNENNCDG